MKLNTLNPQSSLSHTVRELCEMRDENIVWNYVFVYHDIVHFIMFYKLIWFHDCLQQYSILQIGLYFSSLLYLGCPLDKYFLLYMYTVKPCTTLFTLRSICYIRIKHSITIIFTNNLFQDATIDNFYAYFSFSTHLYLNAIDYVIY